MANNRRHERPLTGSEGRKYCKNVIDSTQLERLAKQFGNDYGQYLLDLLQRPPLAD